MGKKERISEIIGQFREFRFCGPSDDPDEKTAVCSGYHYLLTQLQRIATPYLPKHITEPLNSIHVDMNDLFSAYEARAEVDALLDDIEEVIQGMDDSEFKRDTKNSRSHCNNKADLSDLAKDLWGLHQSISVLADDPFRYPDANGYSGEVLAKVAGTKELTKAFFSKHNDPLIKEALVVLSKLHKKVEHIHDDLSFIANPPCPGNQYSTEEAAAFVEKTDKETEATLKNLEKELPGFKEQYCTMLEDIAAKLEVFSNTKDDKQNKSLFDLNIHFSEKDRLLFLDIADSIKAEPNKYKQAGEWLDWFCFDEDKFWKARKIELRQCNCILSPTLTFDKEKRNPVYNENNNEKYQERKLELEVMLKEKATPRYEDRLRDGWEVIFGKFAWDNFLNEEDSHIALLIAWLITDLDANKANLGITKFEDWPWSFIESGCTNPRSNAQRSLLKPNYQYPYNEEDYFKICMKLFRTAAIYLKYDYKDAIQNRTRKETQQLTKEEQKILAEVAEEIRSNPEKFRAAGRLLDSFYNEKQYRQLKLKELAEIKKRDNYEGTETEYAEDCQHRLNGTLPPLSARIEEAWFAFLLKFDIGPILEDTLVPLGRNECLAVLLIAWLISDSEASSLKLKLTQFEQWPWSFIPTGSSEEDDEFYGMPRCGLLKSFIQQHQDEHGHDRLYKRKMAFNCIEYALDYAKNIKTSLKTATPEIPPVKTEQLENRVDEQESIKPKTITIEVDLGDKQFNKNRKGPYDFKEDMRTLADQRYIKYATKEEAIKAKKRIEGRLKAKYEKIKFQKLKGDKILRLEDHISIKIKK